MTATRGDGRRWFLPSRDLAGAIETLSGEPDLGHPDSGLAALRHLLVSVAGPEQARRHLEQARLSVRARSAKDPRVRRAD